MNATEIVRINQMVESDKMNRECFYRVAAPCSHPKCLDAHWDKMAERLKRRNASSEPVT